MPKVLSFSTFLLFRSCVVVVVAPFYWGSIPFNENEMSELNGRMTSREVQFNKLLLTFNIDQKPPDRMAVQHQTSFPSPTPTSRVFVEEFLELNF